MMKTYTPSTSPVWETVYDGWDGRTVRLKVVGGWLIRHERTFDLYPKANEEKNETILPSPGIGRTGTLSMVFVPDARHQWDWMSRQWEGGRTHALSKDGGRAQESRISALPNSSELRNPYRRGGAYALIFDRLMQSPPPTRDELVQWVMDKLGKNRQRAGFDVHVVLSPVRDATRLPPKGKDVRGNRSARGHVYYVEKAAEGRLSVRPRVPPMAPLKA
ncbi:MAG: hypothetical protein FJ280_03860 [Planctomycetes bacterium]|nr:hypothetical protein [Planctomycetota bacterium]